MPPPDGQAHNARSDPPPRQPDESASDYLARLIFDCPTCGRSFSASIWRDTHAERCHAH